MSSSNSTFDRSQKKMLPPLEKKHELDEKARALLEATAKKSKLTSNTTSSQNSGDLVIEDIEDDTYLPGRVAPNSSPQNSPKLTTRRLSNSRVINFEAQQIQVLQEIDLSKLTPKKQRINLTKPTPKATMSSSTQITLSLPQTPFVKNDARPTVSEMKQTKQKNKHSHSSSLQSITEEPRQKGTETAQVGQKYLLNIPVTTIKPTDFTTVKNIKRKPRQVASAQVEDKKVDIETIDLNLQPVIIAQQVQTPLTNNLFPATASSSSSTSAATPSQANEVAKSGCSCWPF